MPIVIVIEFYQANHKDKESKEASLCKLDEIFENALMDPNFIVIISDVSIKNNVTTLILHIHSNFISIKKAIYVRCGSYWE